MTARHELENAGVKQNCILSYDNFPALSQTPQDHI